MPAEGREAEITRIEGELERLRSRYASLKRTTHYVLPFCIVLGVFVLWFLGWAFMAGATGAVVVAVLILLGLVVVGRLSRHPRFIDWASSPEGLAVYPHTSYAEFLESAIAEREKRLQELQRS
jgi:hypothetical protein